MDAMGTNDRTTQAGSASAEPVDPGRADLLRRIDEMWARRHETEVEPPPRLKALVDSQDEYLERIRTITRRITGR